MWYLFAASLCVGALFLYAPGYLIIRTFRVSRLVSLACAPLVSIVAYGVLCIVYPKLGISCSWLTLVVPVFLVPLIACIASHAVKRARKTKYGSLTFGIETTTGIPTACKRSYNWLCLAFYLVMGVVVSAVFFLGNLQDPSLFVQEFDNIFHLGLTRSFLESGNWSPFDQTLYATEAAASINPLPEPTYYPAAWHQLVALIVSSLGVSIPLAANAINYLFMAAVFPLSMFLLMRGLFRDKPQVVSFGALCILGFAAFPWTLIVFGPLYPNMIAFSVLPSVAFCFITLLSQGIGRPNRIVAGTLFCLGIVAFALMQPNTVFALGVFLAPFCVWRISGLADCFSISRVRRLLVRVLLGLIAIICIALIWFALYKAPFLQSVVTHSWPAFESFKESFLHALLLSFRSQAPQLVLAVLVVVGGVYTLFRRKYLWMTCSYALTCALYMVSASSDLPIKFLLTGFWYTDTMRIAAFAALFAIPLAAMGLWVVAKGLSLLLNFLVRRKRMATPLALLAACVVGAAFLALNYATSQTPPDKPDNSKPAFDGVAHSVEGAYSLQKGPHMYDNEEMAFVKEAQQLIPADALVLNIPDDGSAFAYGVDGLNVYYRYLRTYGEDNETEDSKKIRNRLDCIERDASVRDAVEDVNAEYVLLLDQGKPGKKRRYLFTYENARNWKGLTSIRDGLPGFEIVLARDDMRLYKIVLN